MFGGEMLRNIQGDGGVGSEQWRNSEDGQFALAFRKIVRNEVQETMHTDPHVIWPSIADYVRKVVKEQIQSTLEQFFTAGKWTNTNVATLSNERSLCLRFLDEVSDDVLTGKKIKGKDDTPIRVAIVDEITGDTIESGPESSAKVEILFLEARENDNEHNWTHEDFNSRIIKESDKTKPHFAKSYHVYLEKGIGVLSNAKLAHYSNWTKSCKCRLGARVVDNLSGIKVQEAWTDPFVVSDSRGKLYAKHFPPSPSDEVWRLVNIGRDGGPHKRLRKNNVSTVQEFLFLYSVDPQRLQEIVGAPDKAWEAIANHAQSCQIGDTRVYLYNDSSDINTSVVFDAVGTLKGLIHNSQYVVESSLSEVEKDRAYQLLRSAFENLERKVFIGDETTLVRQYPYRASNAALNASSQEGFHGTDVTMSENEDLMDPSTTGLSISLSLGPSVSVNNKTLVHQIPP